MTTKEETLRRIAVMQAWCDGEKIELFTSNKEWAVTNTPVWDWFNTDYRIAPKPKRRASTWRLKLMIKVTEWIPCDVNPRRVGWYEWSPTAGIHHIPIVRHWWDGFHWKWSPRARDAFISQNFGYWRGLTEKHK